MTPNALLIQTPAIDFGTFLSLSQQALGYSPAEAVDASPLERLGLGTVLSLFGGTARSSGGGRLSATPADPRVI